MWLSISNQQQGPVSHRLTTIHNVTDRPTNRRKSCQRRAIQPSCSALKPRPMLVVISDAYYVHRVSKNIPDIFDFNLNKNYQIFVNLVWIFITQLAIKWSLSSSPHPMSASALPRERQSSKICVKICKIVKKTPPTLLKVTWSMIIRFMIFGIFIFDTTGY